MSIRDNILFGAELSGSLYLQAIKSCQLEQDLKVLQSGDQTEVGERGITLSGGQKARLSLARAVYQNSDIYLLDDPISALDVDVRKLIYTEVINGILKDKTRILATHAIDYLEMADRTVIMKEGRIQAIVAQKDIHSHHLI